MAEQKFIHVLHDFATGWPSGIDIYYECQICDTVVSSMKDGQCRCGNITIDIGYARAGAKIVSEVKLVRKIQTS